MDRERGQEETEPQHEQRLHQNHQRQPENVQRDALRPEPDPEDEVDRQPEDEVDAVVHDADHRQDFGREDDLLDQIAAHEQRVRRFREPGREPRPGQQAAEEEQGVGLRAFAAERVDHVREHERVDRQKHQRMHERPQKAEDRAPVARLQFTLDERTNQQAVLQEPSERMPHLATNLWKNCVDLAENACKRKARPVERTRTSDAGNVDVSSRGEWPPRLRCRTWCGTYARRRCHRSRSSRSRRRMGSCC